MLTDTLPTASDRRLLPQERRQCYQRGQALANCPDAITQMLCTSLAAAISGLWHYLWPVALAEVEWCFNYFND